MIHFYEMFGQLIKDERKAKGFTQETLAEAIGVEYGSYKRWERGVRKFPLDILPSLTQTLGSPILVDETGQIKKGKGMMTMNTWFSTDFENFDVKELFEEFISSEQTTAQTLYERAEAAYAKCSAMGWTFTTSMATFPLDIDTPTANHLENGTTYQFTRSNAETWDEPTLTATVCFYLSGDWFNLPRFIEDFERSYGTDMACFVEKAWVYGCLKESKGHDLFNWALYKRDEDSLTRLFPMLAPWASLIAEQIQANDYVEKYEGLIPNYDWYCMLNLVDEYQDQEFVLDWELPDGDIIEVEDVDSLRTFDDLIQMAMIIIGEEYEMIKKQIK